MSDDRPITVAVYSATYTPKGQVPDYVSVTVSWDWLNAGSGTLVVAETDPLAQTLLQSSAAPVLVVVTVAGQRWSGRVASANLHREGPPGSGEITATLVDDWIWLKYMLAVQTGSGPVTPTMAQYDTQTGPAATVAAYYINAAATRLGVPVAAVVPLADTSQQVTLNARATPLADLLTGPLQASGVSCPATIWLPGDTQPLNMHLKRPTVVFTPQQVPGKPWLRWTDTGNGGISKIDLTVNAATGYRAVLGLDTPTADNPATRNFDTYTDPDLSLSEGSYGLPEVYVDATDATFGAASQARGLQELAAHRPTVSATAEIVDGAPWTFGRDYYPGDLPSLQVAGVPFSERITRVTVSDDRTNGLVVTPTVGDVSGSATSDELMVRALANVAQQLRLLQAGR